ncbi:hypothetical protein NGB36_32335 [Streptomyces sp. RB6PN25]|uniref:Secreted protein n=1 Tax=Streptomyces humicola TaxID=2953240 RepID=A0ABT1Q8H6_9ACTN|nr:hypothetical protein [Streptomyces humicola]MCQ4085130.1 hypothetical protein [Streptomyces humicola]
MPLHVPPAPAPALRSVLAALGSPSAVRAAGTPFLSAPDGPLTPEHPLPVHLLDPVPARGGLPQARLTGWRFLIRGADRVVAAADTMWTPDGWAFSHFSEGPYLASTERALHQAEPLTGAYQPRLLSIPGLYMLTLWLHRDIADGDDAQPAPADVLIPLAPAPPGIAAHRPHAVAELLPVLSHRLTPAPAPLLGTVV